MDQDRATAAGASRRRGRGSRRPPAERVPAPTARNAGREDGREAGWEDGPVVEALPCVWMTAGLLRYKLCDRRFDCDRCPLDAALRGAAVAAPGAATDPTAGAPPAPRITFPEELRYGPGHTWLRGSEEAAGEGEGEGAARHRVGLDAFVAALLGAPRKVRPAAQGRDLEPGAPLCELVLEAGTLPVAAPVAGRVAATNPGLAEDPSRLVTAPYGDGWLVDLDLPRTALREGLVGAPEARRRAGHDLRRLRRRIALRILADGGGDGLGPTLPDGGELVTDLRSLLGPRRYLDLLRELVC